MHLVFLAMLCRFKKVSFETTLAKCMHVPGMKKLFELLCKINFALCVSVC